MDPIGERRRRDYAHRRRRRVRSGAMKRVSWPEVLDRAAGLVDTYDTGVTLP
jgi:hypothetical protein